MTIPAIGISIGDPGGIGPEVTLKALGRIASLPEAKYIVFGPKSVLDSAGSSLGLRPSFSIWRGACLPVSPGLYLKETEGDLSEVLPGQNSAGNGRIAFAAFREAVEAARTGILDAVVTAPISKASWNLAGILWKGHTEYLETLYPGTIMTFWSGRLRVALFSHHLSLRAALDRLDKESLCAFLRNLHGSLARVHSGVREILVAGLNPHAGEGGLMGREEIEILIPAIETARREGLPVSGPFPPDTVFLQALDRPDRMIAALYHDQGLIGFKIESFADGVNTTLGMPFVRTSPDHGTAFDIAGQGVADPGSMMEALRLATRLS